MNGNFSGQDTDVPYTEPPIRGLPELVHHINDLQEYGTDGAIEVNDSDSGTEIHVYNVELFDEVNLQVTDANRSILAQALLPQLVAILRMSDCDIEPTLPLMLNLLQDMTFDMILGLADARELILILTSPHKCLNLLGLEIVHKASKTVEGARTFGMYSELLRETLYTCFMAEDDEIGARAATVIADILETDCPMQPEGREAGSGAVWDTLFRDEDMTVMMRRSTRHLERAGVARYSRGEITLAQSRLLRILERAVLLDPGLMLEHKIFKVSTACMVDADDELLYRDFIAWWEKVVSMFRVLERRTAELDEVLGERLRDSCVVYPRVRSELETLADRTVEEEAEPLRQFVHLLLNGS